MEEEEQGGPMEWEAHMVRRKLLTPDVTVTNRVQMKKPTDALHPPSPMTTPLTTTTLLWTTTTIIDNDEEKSECAQD